MSLRFEETKYGFNYGAAEVTRLFSDEKKGWVTIGVDTPKFQLQIYVTKTGKVRVHRRKLPASQMWPAVELEEKKS